MSIFGNLKLNGVDKDGQVKEFSLAELGEKIVLYFYPKDNTLRCTQQAREFRDMISRMNPDTKVIGVSPDSVDSHREFLYKNGLNFPLLSDPDNTLAQRLCVNREKTENGEKYMTVERSTFIIQDGLIQKAWKGVNVDGHAEEVISSL